MVAVALASDSGTLPEATELLQEHAAVEAKTMAKAPDDLEHVARNSYSIALTRWAARRP